MTVSSDFFNESSSRDGNVKRIRQGEAAATVLTLLEGGAASYLVGSWLPLIAATAIAVLFVGGYEYALANPAAHESDYAQSSAAVALRPRQFGAR
jgi:hypothetical protein